GRRGFHRSALACPVGDAADDGPVLCLGRPRCLVPGPWRGVVMRPVLVFGGYGTFGAHVCRELARRGVPVTVAGRDPAKAEALALQAREGTVAPVARVRVTLFIGNQNPKGEAAVRSLLAGLGRPIRTAEGTVRGFRDREVVALPAPFGRRGVFNFEAPEYDLF